MNRLPSVPSLSLPTGLSKHRIERVGCEPVGLLARVDVEPESGRHVRMSEELLEDLYARPEFDLIARVEVAQSVE